MRILTTLILVLINGSAWSQEASTLGYVTAREYLELHSSARIYWLVGALDGFLAEQAAHADNQGPWLTRCLKDVPSSQTAAMFEKYLNDHQESLHAPASFLLRETMLSFCKNRE